MDVAMVEAVLSYDTSRPNRLLYIIKMYKISTINGGLVTSPLLIVTTISDKSLVINSRLLCISFYCSYIHYADQRLKAAPDTAVASER